MSAETSRFAKLIELAHVPSSDKRRELLREVTDLFFETQSIRGQRENALFDEVLKTVAANMDEEVLSELAEQFADAPDAPPELMRGLAVQPIAVAEAVLRRCRALTDDDLVRVVESKGQEHLRAVASRPEVSERLSEAIVRNGDDGVVETLIRNDGARISRQTMETVVDRARASPALHEGVVGRRDLPVDLLNELYFVVEGRLRAQILSRNAALDPAELDAALAKTRARVAKSFEARGAESRRAQAWVQARKAEGALKPALLVQLYRDGKREEFLFGLAELVDVDVETASDILERQDLDALATVCRAADLERPLFVTLAVLTCGGEQAFGKAEEFGRIYAAVPVEAARRAVRFFKVRRGAADGRAA